MSYDAEAEEQSFGDWKHKNIDGLAYQNVLRTEWDPPPTPSTPDALSLPLTDKERLQKDGWTAFTPWTTFNSNEPDLKYYKHFPLTLADNSEEEFMLACAEDHEDMDESLKGDIPRVQVCLSVYTSTHGVDQGDRYALNIEGQLADRSWCKVDNHMLPSNLDAVLACIPRLLRMWRAIHSTSNN